MNKNRYGRQEIWNIMDTVEELRKRIEVLEVNEETAKEKIQSKVYNEMVDITKAIEEKFKKTNTLSDNDVKVLEMILDRFWPRTGRIYSDYPN